MNRRTGTRGVPRPEREASIVDSALVLFGERGHSLVSLDAVATHADVSKALVVSYFGSKDALYLACVQRVVDQVVPGVQNSVSTQAPGLVMAIDALRTMAESVRERPRDWRLLHDASFPEGSPLVDQVTELRAPLHELAVVGVRNLLTEHASRRAGAPVTPDERDVEALVRVWSALLRGAMEWWFDRPDETPESLTERFTRIVEALLELPHSTEPAPSPV